MTARLLLDTHVLLWVAHAPERLGRLADVIAEPSTELHLSSVSTLEMAVKVSIGKLRLPGTVRDVVAQQVRLLGLLTLAPSHDHAAMVADLPLHHRDPFDRLLVAQAATEDLTLATADPEIARYDVEVMRP